MAIGFPDELAVAGDIEIAVIDPRREPHGGGLPVLVVAVPVNRVSWVLVLKIEKSKPTRSDSLGLSPQITKPHAIGKISLGRLPSDRRISRRKDRNSVIASGALENSGKRWWPAAQAEQARIKQVAPSGSDTPHRLLGGHQSQAPAIPA
jgi:hypothetical protein